MASEQQSMPRVWETLYLNHNRQIGLHEVLDKLLVAEIVLMYDSNLGSLVLARSCICMVNVPWLHAIVLL